MYSANRLLLWRLLESNQCYDMGLQSIAKPSQLNLRCGFWCGPSTHDPRNHFRYTQCRSDPSILTMMPFTNIDFSPEHKGSYLCPQNLYTTNSVMTTTLVHQSNDFTHCVCLAENRILETQTFQFPSLSGRGHHLGALFSIILIFM